MNLSALDDCFEGVIPSILATASEEGVPNISYLSHVARVDDRHIALSNQFFGKTMANLRANPRAEVLVVDGAIGRQYRLDVVWLREDSEGPVFERISAALNASSAQIGMADVMRLTSVGLFRVDGIHPLPHPSGEEPPPPAPRDPILPRLAAAIAAIGSQTESAGVVEAALSQTCALLNCPAAVLFQHDPARGTLFTVASRGYPASGAGSELALGEGVAGAAAASGQVQRVSDASRVYRFAAAIRASTGAEDITPAIPLPGLEGAQSRIAAPLVVRGQLWGAIFAESEERFLFRSEDELALRVFADHAASTLLLAEALAAEGPAASPMTAARPAFQPGNGFRVVHYSFDDSVFIDDQYLIRGVAGRLLAYLLGRYETEGRTEFSNREIRLAPELRLPDYKDNLETRLLLLRQRLEEKSAPVRIERAGRGLLRLALSGSPRVEVIAT